MNQAQQTEARTTAVIEAIARITDTRALAGAVDCPLCKTGGALRFRQRFAQRKRARARLVLEAKCTTAGCLEFMS